VDDDEEKRTSKTRSQHRQRRLPLVLLVVVVVVAVDRPCSVILPPRVVVVVVVTRSTRILSILTTTTTTFMMMITTIIRPQFQVFSSQVADMCHAAAHRYRQQPQQRTGCANNAAAASHSQSRHHPVGENKAASSTNSDHNKKKKKPAFSTTAANANSNSKKSKATKSNSSNSNSNNNNNNNLIDNISKKTISSKSRWPTRGMPTAPVIYVARSKWAYYYLSKKKTQRLSGACFNKHGKFVDGASGAMKILGARISWFLSCSLALICASCCFGRPAACARRYANLVPVRRPSEHHQQIPMTTTMTTTTMNAGCKNFVSRSFDAPLVPGLFFFPYAFQALRHAQSGRFQATYCRQACTSWNICTA
jgi:hypothetical protein